MFGIGKGSGGRRNSSGRYLDPVWNNYHIVAGDPGKPGCRVKCKHCPSANVKECAGLVKRMREHQQKCHSSQAQSQATSSTALGPTVEKNVDNPQESDMDSESSDLTTASTSMSAASAGASSDKSRTPTSTLHIRKSTLDTFIVRTLKSETDQLDIQVARMVYATNSPFSIVEHPEFVKMIKKLRPGYEPPNRKAIGGNLLDSVFSSVEQETNTRLKGKTVCMSIDGWSDVHNDPIVCISVTNVADDNRGSGLSKTYLVDTIDTSGHPHTGDYLLEITAESVKKCEEKLDCHVRSFVTDNAANMAKMRSELAAELDKDVITYGCSAHLLNLLAHDIEVPGVKGHVVAVMKYFRNVHFAKAKYEQAGGKGLVIPQDVRWNTLCDALESYLTNWPILVKVCEENRAAFNTDIVSKVTNIGLKRNIEDYHSDLKIIAVALDRIQRDDCTIGETTEIWLDLIEKMETTGKDQLVEKVQHRMEMATTDAHLLANILDPRFRGAKLSDEQNNQALEYASNYHPLAMPIIINYNAKGSPFLPFMFQDGVLIKISPLNWWMSFADRLGGADSAVIQLIKQLHTAVGSSAGLERIFSTFGFVKSKVRNKLGTEKAAKLVTIFKMLNSYRN